MVLEDATNVLANLRFVKIEPGEYKVINNNPRSHKIADLATSVKDVLCKHGMEVKISRNKYDPRQEKSSDGIYPITTGDSVYFKKNFNETDIVIEIERSMQLIKDNLNEVNREVLYPKLDWSM